MKASAQKVPTRFTAETMYEVPIPVVSVAWLPGSTAQEIERFKTRLLCQMFNEPENAALHQSLQLAAEEAASLAWLTPFPLLVLPILLDEKVQVARAQAARQERIRRRSQVIFAHSIQGD
ncbi:MAG: hypothetical protein M1608_06570 [Candidatus Omnitrophica bacterium]|nr:hypothetical protein [Candidatus Omnitrophota bacterium]